MRNKPCGSVSLRRLSPLKWAPMSVDCRWSWLCMQFYALSADLNANETQHTRSLASEGCVLLEGVHRSCDQLLHHINPIKAMDEALVSTNHIEPSTLVRCQSPTWTALSPSIGLTFPHSSSFCFFLLLLPYHPLS